FWYGRDEADSVVELLRCLARRNRYDDRSEEAGLVADRQDRAAGLLANARLSRVVARPNALVEGFIVGGLGEGGRQLRRCDRRGKQVVARLRAAFVNPRAELGVEPVEPLGSVAVERGTKHAYGPDRKRDAVAERLRKFTALVQHLQAHQLPADGVPAARRHIAEPARG